MGVRYDTAKLIAAVKRDAFTAKSDDNWTDENILSVADDCMLGWVAPVLKETKQGRFRADKRQSMTADLADYDFPEDCMFLGIESIHLLDSDGNVMCKLNEGSASNRGLYASADDGVPSHFWMNDTTFTVLPTPDSGTATDYTMAISYYRRPSQLVKTTDVLTISVLSYPSITVTGTSTYITTNGTSPYKLDFYSGTYPHSRKLFGITVPSVTSVASPINFGAQISATDFATLAVGDIVSLHGTTIFPGASELFPYLQRMVQQSILTSQKDANALQLYLATQAERLHNFLQGHGDRSDGTPRKLSLWTSAAAHFVGANRVGWRSGGS